MVAKHSLLTPSFPPLVVILVTGGREYKAANRVYHYLDMALEDFGDQLVIVEGGARGADSHARAWAAQHAVVCCTLNAPWTSAHGHGAGKLRNGWMIDYFNVNFVLAFPGGSGTAHMCKLAANNDIRVFQCQ